MRGHTGRGLAVQLAMAALLAACSGSQQDAPAGAASKLSPQTATVAASTRQFLNGYYVETGQSSVPAQVYRLYRAAFGRTADPQGLGYHVGQIEVFGHTILDVAANFVASPEFQQSYGSKIDNLTFIVLMYANVLHRTASADEQNYYLDAMANGRTRAEVLLGFSDSRENRDNTASDVAAGLTFEAYPATRVYLTDGTYVETNPDGTAAQVFRLYQAAFARSSDAQGLGFHVGSIENLGVSLQQVSQNFIDSPEFKQRYGASLTDSQFIIQLYANVLHRVPSTDEVNYYLATIATGSTRAQLLLNFSESPENKANTAPSISLGIHFVPYPKAPSSPPVDPYATLPTFDATAAMQLWGVLAEGMGGDNGGDGGAGGGAGDGAPLGNATVVLVDSQGHTVSGKTDANGNYLLRFNTSVFTPPFVVRVSDANGNVLTSTSNETVAAGKAIRINVNPLTDKVTSDVLHAGVGGTDKTFTGGQVDPSDIATAKSNLMQSISAALVTAGVANPSTLDVVTSVYPQNGGGVDGVIESLIHTRDPVSGATQLRVKAASPDDASAIVTAATPLPPSAVLTPSSPELTLTKLTSWMNYMNACFRSPAADFLTTTTLGTCSMQQLAPAVSSTYKDGGRDIWITFEQVYRDTDNVFLPGSELRNPQVRYIDSYPGSSTQDMAVVDFTLHVPTPEFDGSNDPNFDASKPIEYTLTLVFKRDDVTPGLAAGNWILHGDQHLYQWAVTPSYLARTQVNPARDLNTSGNDPSLVYSRLRIPFSGYKLNTRADWPYVVQQNSAGFNDVYAVRVKGPGLPSAGLVLAPNGFGGVTIHNKTGVIPSAGTTAATGQAWFHLSAYATTSQQVVSSGVWNGASPALADTPTTVDFTQLKPMSVYTAEIYRTGGGPILVEKFRMAPGVVAPAQAAQLPQIDLSANAALVTPTHSSQTSVTVNWVRTPGAMVANTVQLGQYTTRNQTGAPSITDAFASALDYYPSRRDWTSITLGSTNNTSLPAQSSSIGRQVVMFGWLGGASFWQQYQWTP